MQNKNITTLEYLENNSTVSREQKKQRTRKDFLKFLKSDEFAYSLAALTAGIMVLAHQVKMLEDKSPYKNFPSYSEIRLPQTGSLQTAKKLPVKRKISSEKHTI